MEKPTAPCTIPWCESGPHVAGTAHYAAVVDLRMEDGTDVSIDLAEHERLGGPRVLVALHLGGEEGGQHLELGPTTAYVLAQLIAAMDPALVLQFAERLAYAAVTLDPRVAAEVGK